MSTPEHRRFAITFQRRSIRLKVSNSTHTVASVGHPPLQVWSADDLLPAPWRGLARPDACYFFNPSIASHRGERLMAYRVVLPDQRRRIAVCRLDPAGRIEPGSTLALSDLLVDAGDWHADPRFCVFGERLLLHFNNGARTPNDIFLVELDPGTLHPMAPCRTLLLDHRRNTVEKNWMFFEHAGELYTVYSIAPHRVHRVRLDAPGPIRCESAHMTTWHDAPYTARFGSPRGSTPPVRLGDHYFSFFHSQYRKPFGRRLLTAATRGTRLRATTYGIGFYAFRAAPPFAPALFSPALLFEPPVRRRSPRPPLATNYDSCVYPSGAVHDSGRWLVSAGLHDDACGLISLTHDDLLRAAAPARPA